MWRDSLAVRFPKVAQSLVRLAASCSRPKSWSLRLWEGSHLQIMAAIATLCARSRFRDWLVVRPECQTGQASSRWTGPRPSSRPPGWPGPPQGCAFFSIPRWSLWPSSPLPRLVPAIVNHLGPKLRVSIVLSSLEVLVCSQLRILAEMRTSLNAKSTTQNILSYL